jgi:hypothetical protein
MPTKSGIPRTAAALLVAALALAALALRARGIGFGLPHATHADARVLVAQVEALENDRPDPAGHRLYPHLVPRLAALAARRAPPLPPGADASDHRARASEPWLRARWVAVLCSLPLVPLTYRLARAVLARGPALFAAALVATSLLQLSFSQQERPHSALASTTALAVCAALHLRRRPGWTSYSLAGLALALALGSLHSGLAVIPPLLAAHWLRRRAPAGEPRRGGWRGGLRFALTLGLGALSVPLFYPFHLRGPDGARAAPRENLRLEEQGERPVLNMSGHFVDLGSFDGSGFAEAGGAVYAYDPLLALLCAAGLASLLLRRPRAGAETRRDGLVLLAYALPYTLAIGLYAKTPERFTLPLAPFAAIAAARGAGLLAARIPRALAWCAALLALAFPAYLCLRLGSLRAAPDTYAEAAAWIERELEPTIPVALLLDPYQDLPLVPDAPSLAANAARPWASPWTAYLAAQPSLPPGRELRAAPAPGRAPAGLAADPLAAFAELGARYAVVELVPSGPKSDVQRAVREFLAAETERRFRSSPLVADTGKSERLFSRSVSFANPMFARVLAARCTGPTLEIYRLPAP